MIPWKGWEVDLDLEVRGGKLLVRGLHITPGPDIGPDDGLTAEMLRGKLPLAQMARKQHVENARLDEAQLTSEAEQLRARANQQGGGGDLLLVETVDVYERYAQVYRNPLIRLSEELGLTGPGLKARLQRARDKGYMHPAGGPGVAGGGLTDKGQKLLDEYREALLASARQED